MDGKMKVAVMEAIGKIKMEERDIPKAKDNEVLVKLEYVGICGSDLHYYETGAIGDFVVEPPFVLGHEPGGTVVEVGKDVKHLKVGDRVALEPGKTCGHFLQPLRLTEYFRNMWLTKQIFVSNCRKM